MDVAFRACESIAFLWAADQRGVDRTSKLALNPKPETHYKSI